LNSSETTPPSIPTNLATAPFSFPSASRMIEVAFLFFSSAVAVTFFVSSLILMNLGRRLGARYLVREGTPTVTGLNAVEGAVFALMGLVLAFAISYVIAKLDVPMVSIFNRTMRRSAGSAALR